MKQLTTHGTPGQADDADETDGRTIHQVNVIRSPTPNYFLILVDKVHKISIDLFERAKCQLLNGWTVQV